MKKWQVVLAILMSMVMVVMVTLAIVPWVVDVQWKNDATTPTTGNVSNEPTDAHKPVHTQQVVVTFADGIMRCIIKEQCDCGVETVFGNVSRSKDSALNIIGVIKCEHEVFSIKEGDEEKLITREDLIKKVNEYEFAEKSQN